MKIKDICARQILDSRGNPTVEVDVTLESGAFGRASVPSGASTGMYEAVELRDGDKANYGGKSVLKAVGNVNGEIRDAVIGFNALKQGELDNMLIALDGAPNKARLGANAILGVSLAVARAVANASGIPLYVYLSSLYYNGAKSGVLSGENMQFSAYDFGSTANINEVAKIRVHQSLPRPMLNILNGGKHADNSVNIQEFMVVPMKCEPFSEGLRKSVEVYFALNSILKAEGYSTTVGDEGGFAPNLKDDEDALKYIVQAIAKAGYKPYEDFCIALDIASSEMKQEAIKAGNPQGYYFWKSGKMFTASEFIEYQQHLVANYPIISIEDGLGEDDYANWAVMTSVLGDKIQLVGDDLFVTNVERLKNGIDGKLSNAILIKPNQIGTLSETLGAIRLAKESGFGTIISHRSGETDDTFIADLAVATNAKQIKTGAPSRIDRVCKYNRLLQIEELIKKQC